MQDTSGTGVGNTAVDVDFSGRIKAQAQAVINGLQDVQPDGVSVYPNPTSASWFISVANAYLGKELQIIDADGRLVYKATIRNKKTEVAIPQLPAGTYTMKLGSNSMKLLKL